MTTTFDSSIPDRPEPDDFDPTVDGSAFGGAAGTGAVADLSAFDDDYEEVEAPSHDELPDGKYQARVHRVELGRSQNGDPMLKWDLVVISGQHAGRHIWKNAVITHKSLPFVKGDLQTLGVQLAKFSDLPQRLDELLDQTLEITQRTRGEYRNVYFNRRLDVPAGASGGAFERSGLGDEPAPF